MNKNLKIVLILLSTLLVSILGVRQCINEYGDLSSVGMGDDSDRSSQDHIIYQLDDEGDYIRLKGKKQFRDPQDIAKDYYVYITNSYFSNMPPMIRTDSEDSPDFSMGTSFKALLDDKREIEPQFLVLDYSDENMYDVPGISLITAVIEEIEEDMQFDTITEILEIQIDEMWKKMYPEDIVLLDRIKSEIPDLITTYTNMDNHLETDHEKDYEIRHGQWYYIYVTRYISPYTGKQFYTLRMSRLLGTY